VAARAGDAAVGRELLVVEQAFAERALRLAERVRCGKRDRSRAAEFFLQRGKTVRSGALWRGGRDAARKRKKCSRDATGDERGRYRET
jgi:hypothetical protein